MHKLLLHVVAELCDDPDCEVHHPEVGRDEGTVSDVNLAFFIAGAHAMEVAMRREFRRSTEEDPIKRIIAASLEAGRPILDLASEHV